MRILLVTQYFYPEVFKSNDLAFELVRRGHHVDALVGIPNYPDGNYFKGYGLFSRRHEKVNGVNVYRCFQTPRGKGGWRLPLNYFTYVLSGCLHILCRHAWRKYDCIIGHEPSPIFQAYPALLLRKIRKIPFYYWIMDLWPDAMTSGGGVKNKRVLAWVDRLVKGIYQRSDKLLITSRQFREQICEKGDFGHKIVYFPNWSDDILKLPADYPIPDLPKGFVIMVAGNLGKSQDLESITRTMLELRDTPEVRWVFVGGGSRRQWLEDFIKKNNLSSQAVCLGQYPFEAMGAFYRRADAMLVSLKGGFRHLEAVVPARLQSYMSAGRPVLGMLGSGGAEIIREADCGLSFAPGDHKAMADAVRELLSNPRRRADFESKGKNGREYYEQNFRMETCIDNLEEIISRHS